MIDQQQVRDRAEQIKALEEKRKGNGGIAEGLRAEYTGEVPISPIPPLKIDLGCGQTKPEGYVGVDLVEGPGVDVVCDLIETLRRGQGGAVSLWPFEDSSADEICCSHFFEHVPGRLRPMFMEEVWRILKPGASAFITTPYWSSVRSVQDFTHEWPPVGAESYAYFNEEWRRLNKLTHAAYDIACNFDVHFPAQMLDPRWAASHPDVLAFAAKHYINSVLDLTCQLVKRDRLPPEEAK